MEQGGVHATVLPQPGEILADRYVIESIIGCGAMTVVFGARHRVSGRRCAIKLLLPEQRAALPALESRATPAPVSGGGRLVGHFQHPHVLDIQDVGEVRGSFYTVMDWMDGESLAARLARVGSLSVDELRQLIVPCIRGMHAAHAAGIVHRYLNPSSIFICQGSARVPEMAKILDFGVAEFSDSEAAARAALTRLADVHAAASDYLSPEQRCGLPADHRADVYAFGAIVYRALSGQPPTAWHTHDRRLVFSEPPPLKSNAPGVSAGGAIARRAMTSELSERFQSLAELADALEFFKVPPRGLAALPPSIPPRWSPPPQPLMAAVDVPVTRAADTRISAPRVSFPPPGPARPLHPSKWLYIALGTAALASAAALWLENISSEETDAIASFEGVAGETANKYHMQPEASPAPPAPAPPSVASPSLAPKAGDTQPSAAAPEAGHPRVLRLPLTPPPVRREREPARPRAAAPPAAAPKPAQQPAREPVSPPSVSVDELQMNLF
jgi:eukaryotic-like serine/threonine-protein kinase